MAVLVFGTYRSVPFTVPVILGLYRSGSFLSKRSASIGTDRYCTGIDQYRPEKIGTILFLYWSIPLQYWSFIKEGYLNDITPVLFSKGKYRSITACYRSNTALFHRYLTGIFQGSSVPFRTGTLPFRSDIAPLYRPAKTAAAYYVLACH